MKLHYFFPENDLALALNQTHYTPPPAASRLRISGASLPIWYGNNGDEFIADGINARWLNNIRNTFGMDVRVYGGWHSGLEPEPWGWSKASRHSLELRGVPAEFLPSSMQLDCMRSLSHRSTARLLALHLAGELPFEVAPAAQEITTLGAAAQFLAKYKRAVFKLPWSSSGRGLIVINEDEINARAQALEGAIHRQGMLLAEPRMDKTLDFALLYNINAGKCIYAGISVFETVQFGSYSANRLAPQDELWEMADEACGRGKLRIIADALPQALEKIVGKTYNGPLGIDMMAVKDEAYSIAPVVELNLRMTMGHVCRRMYEKYITPGVRGSFGVSSQRMNSEAEIKNGKLHRGQLVLTPPAVPFTFYVKTQ